MLPPLTVEGEAWSIEESAYGPVNGYVATRSATGAKTDTPLIETPQSISVVTADQIADLKPQTVAESLRYSPGIRVETLGVQPVTDAYVLRGFSEPVSNLYQDGLRRAGGFFGYDPIEPYGLERVETFRGPASVLYGQNGPGGLINVVTKRPPEIPIREIELRGGSFDLFQGAFDVGEPIDDDKKLGYRLTGLVRDSKTQVNFVDNNRQFIAGAFSWRPSDQTSLTVLADYINHNGQFISRFPAAAVLLDNPNGTVPSNRFTGEPGYDKMTNERYSLAYFLEHEFSDTLVVRQNLRYGYLDVDRKDISSAGLQADQRTLNRNAYATFATGDVFTVDNQLETNFETGSLSHEILVGADYIYREYDTRGAYGGGGVAPIDIFNPVYGAPVATRPITYSPLQKDNQFGLYVQDHIKLGGLSLLLSGRHDWANSDQKNRISGARTKREDTAFTGRAGLVYRFANGLAPYISYSESFKPVGGTNAAGQPFDPETGAQYEVGLKYEPTFFEGSFTIALFDLRRQNVTTSDPANPGFRVQTGEVSSKGIEFEGRAEMSEGLSLIASYTYTDVAVTKSNGADLGKSPAKVPDHAASLWTRYAPRSGALKDWDFGAGVRYVGETFGNNLNTLTVPDFTVVDAAIGFDLGAVASALEGARLELNAVNLFDKEYVSCGFNFCHFGARQNISVTLRYDW